jgi:GMP synthase (glutamine-hydrolysing)
VVTKVLIVKTGDVASAVRAPLGDYDRWFVQTLGRRHRRFDVLGAHQGARPPADARAWDAVLVTGSPASVTEDLPWMRRWGQWLAEAGERKVPVLAVCFGHQLLGRVYGGTVRKNRRGREIGAIACDLTPAGRRDPLFEGIPSRFWVNATHEDLLEDAPPSVNVLAGNENTPLQAFAVGKYVRAVQFHPEIDPAVMAGILEARRPALEKEARAAGEAPSERLARLRAGMRPTPAGPRILENFLRRFV